MSITLKSRVESYDVSPNNLIRQSSVFRLCQKAAGDDLDSFGGSFDTLFNNNLAFVVTKMEITYFSDIKTYDELQIVSRPRGIEGPFFIRDYDISVDGKRCAYASSHWVLIDTLKRHFRRPSSLSSICNIPEDTEDMLKMEMKRLHLNPLEMEKCDERKVYYSTIDKNNHMNNTFYPDILFDYLPDDFKRSLIGKTITIQYSSEVLCGETLTIYKKELPNEFFILARCESSDKEIFSAGIKKA